MMIESRSVFLPATPIELEEMYLGLDRVYGTKISAIMALIRHEKMANENEDRRLDHLIVNGRTIKRMAPGEARRVMNIPYPSD